MILEWVCKPNSVPVRDVLEWQKPLKRYRKPATVIHLGGELLRALERPTRRS